MFKYDGVSSPSTFVAPKEFWSAFLHPGDVGPSASTTNSCGQMSMRSATLCWSSSSTWGTPCGRRFLEVAMPWTCSALPFQPIRSFTILLFFSVLKDLWYDLWFHFVNELILQCKIWWVFAFYHDHWSVSTARTFQETSCIRTLRAPATGRFFWTA